MSLLPYIYDHLPFHRVGMDSCHDDCPAKIGKDGYQVCLDVQHFQPKQVSVKTENNTIVVHAKHEEKKDEHGYVSREFTRRYTLPDGFRIEDVVAILSSDGILSIQAPNPTSAIDRTVRYIQIHLDGPAKSNIFNKDEKKEE